MTWLRPEAGSGTPLRAAEVRDDASIGAGHLLWIPGGAAASFIVALILGDWAALPVDLYYLAYFVVVIAFFAVYVKRTSLELLEWVARRLPLAIGTGIVVGVMMVRQVLAHPATEQLEGSALAWAIAWRGLVYGGVDGLLLFAFPWLVTWRAFGAEHGTTRRRVAAGAVAWFMVLFVTTVYHLGYTDFRSSRVVQPNIGSAITALPTLVAANPVASPIAHLMLHVSAVIHAPRTELFLPPHREAP